MEIRIVTNGIGAETNIYINGELQNNLTFFTLTARPFGKVKCQMVREVVKNGQKKEEFISYYGGDFEKNDELYGKKNLKKEEK